MQVLCREPLMLDDLRLQLSRKQKLSTIVGRHSNFYARPSEADRLCLEIAQLRKRIAELEVELAK